MENDSKLSFEPSFRVLSRMLKALLKGSMIKTALLHEVNVDYTRFKKHVAWLEERQIVEQTVEKGKVVVRLTKVGREVTSVLFGDRK